MPQKELFVRFKYNGELYSEKFIGRLEAQFRLIINILLENPDQPISEISILTDEDKNLIAEINNTDCPYEQTNCIHQKIHPVKISIKIVNTVMKDKLKKFI